MSGSKGKTPRKSKAKGKGKNRQRLSPEEVQILRAEEARKRADEKVVDDWERELELRKEFEKEHEDLAPWVGFHEYMAARKSEGRLRALGILGAIFRGEKRAEIRRKYRISPNKLNAILNSELVDDLAAHALGNLFSFTSAAQQAILWRLQNDHDGGLAMALLEKLGVFARAGKITAPGAAGKDGENDEDVIGLLFAKGNGLQARQAVEQIQKLVVDGIKSQEPDSVEPDAPRRRVQHRRVGD